MPRPRKITDETIRLYLRARELREALQQDVPKTIYRTARQNLRLASIDITPAPATVTLKAITR